MASISYVLRVNELDAATAVSDRKRMKGTISAHEYPKVLHSFHS